MIVRPHRPSVVVAISSVAFSLVVCLGALGCGTAKAPPVDFSSAPRSYRAEDYPGVYQRWTRHEKVTHELEAVLEVWATFKSRDFREAFVSHYASAYSLSEPDRERLRESQREAAAAGYEFMITAQSANYRWNDLEKKSSPWRVTLVDGAGHELAPDELKVEKLPDMFEREFFPVKTPFTKTYAVRFSRSGGKEDDFIGEQSGRIILRCAGPLGSANLEWSARH
jgi:hypothetical protein